MRTIAHKQSANNSAKHKKNGDRVRSPRHVSPLSTGMPLLQRQCACGGGCPRCKEELGIQTKLKISEPGDRYEQEADRIADEVMRMPKPSLQRQVEPEDEDEEIIQRKTAPIPTPLTSDMTSSDVPPIVQEVLNSPGHPLDPKTRVDFEQRFDRDFASVQIHTDSRAAEAATAVNALAYTVGNHIVFGSDFEPSERGASRRLLAHELVHVIQQQATPDVPVLARQFHTRTFQERGGGGTTDFIETVQNAPTRSGSTITGRVDRSQVAPAAGSTPQQTIPSGSVNVEFDTSTCTVKVPYRFDFNQVSTANPPFCQDPPNTTAVQPLPAQEFQALRSRYVQYVNEGLNGLFTARMTGCQEPCVDGAIPIRIDARDDASSPDRVNVVNRSGRGNAGTICVGNMDRHFAVHESGHQILALGDEYRESDSSLRQQIPEWARDERVRTDLTYMGAVSEYGRFSLFHQRHFRFAQVFLESAFPGCTVTVEEVPRTIPDFRFSFDGSYARIPGGNALTVGGGFDVGLPLTRLRQAELLLGLRGRYLMETAGQLRTALLAGVQVGVEGRTSPAGVAATFGLFTGGGAYHQFGSSGFGRPPVPERTSWFLEGGGSIGVATGMSGSGPSWSAGLEAAGGSELLDSPDAMRWFRLGLKLGAEL